MDVKITWYVCGNKQKHPKEKGSSQKEIETLSGIGICPLLKLTD